MAATLALAAPTLGRAESVTCTLETPDDKESVRLFLRDEKVAARGAGSVDVHDLTFYQRVTCTKGTCWIYLDFFSERLQAKVASIEHKFDRLSNGILFRERIRNAPDQLPYEVSCSYMPTY